MFVLAIKIRSNGKSFKSKQKEEKWNKKMRRKLPQPRSTFFGEVCLGERMVLGGGRIRREGVNVRELAWVGWTEETQRKTKGCGVKEGSERNHVVVMI